MDAMQELSALGMDSFEVLDRFGGNTDLIMRMAVCYAEEGSGIRLREAFEARDWPEVARNAHSLKGVSLNLGLTEVAACCDRVVSGIRAGHTEELSDEVRGLLDLHRSVSDGILAVISQRE